MFTCDLCQKINVWHLDKREGKEYCMLCRLYTTDIIRPSKVRENYYMNNYTRSSGYKAVTCMPTMVSAVPYEDYYKYTYQPPSLWDVDNTSYEASYVSTDSCNSSYDSSDSSYDSGSCDTSSSFGGGDSGGGGASSDW